MADPVAPHRAAVAISQIVRCGLKGAAEYPHRLPRHTLGLYLQYCETYLGLHPSPDHARNLALRIVAESPNFSWGWSALAQAAGALYVGATSNDRAAYLAEVRRASTRAIQLDAHNGQAYEILTYVLPPHAYVEREALLNKAVQAHLTGCGCELVSMGNFLTSVGRTREAKAYFRRAYDLQPFYVPAATGLGLRMDDLGDWQGAELIFARLAETAGGGGLWPSIHASYRDDWSSAQRYVTNVPLPVRPALAQAVEALASGDKRRIAAARPPLEQAASFLQTQRSMASFAVVNALVALGSDDEAFRQLDALAARGATGVLFYAREQALAHDPRYADLLQKYGLMAYWRSSRTRPDLCTHPQAPDFCRRLPRMETSATAPKGVAVT